MIIARSPLRITLGGGGTDLRSYYRECGGLLIAAAIDKYVYITLHQTFVPWMIVKYSQMERVEHARDLQHPIIREAMNLLGLSGAYLELTSMADIPAGTGLGSSGSFTTALLMALHTYQRNIVQRQDLAEQACHIEIERLDEPVGKQDPYIAAFGGVTCFEFRPDDTVAVTPLQISPETLSNLEDHLMLFFTGSTRRASDVLRHQDRKTREADDDMLNNLHYVKELGQRSKQALLDGDILRFGELMHEHWEHKKKRSAGMSTPQIDEWYELARRNGVVGGKLIGAGGGGFIMFLTEDKLRLRHAMKEASLNEVRFRFDFEGSKILVNQ